MIVIDASAANRIGPGDAPWTRIMGRVLRPNERLHAPHLIDLEVAQSSVATSHRGPSRSTGVTRRWKTGSVYLSIANPHDLLLPRIWSFRHNTTAYDASYLALAEVLDAPLVTCDRRLASVPGQSAVVEVF
jgi:predicted nucleic acid-binding protein